jgi:hypothetical protein
LQALKSAVEAALPERVILGGVAKAELRQRLAAASVKLNQLAEDLFADDRFQTGAEGATVGVRAVCPEGLGFPEGANTGELTVAAQRRGLVFCPLELGPHLRLQYMQQAAAAESAGASSGKAPPGAITLVSQPPDDADHRPWGFYLHCVGGQQWLRGYRSWSGHVWHAKDVLVFMRARSAI